MLTRFEVVNFKGFHGRHVFDLTARDYAFNDGLVKNGIVKNVLVYGPNGIGKTNLGLALFDVVSHLTDNEQMHKKYLYEYKNLDAREDESVDFRYVFKFDTIGEIEYEYSKNAGQALLREKLSVNGAVIVEWDYFDRTRRFLDRTVFKTVNVELVDNKLSLIKYLYRNIPTGEVPSLTILLRFVENMLWYRSLSDGNTYAGFSNGDAMLGDVICKSGKLAEFAEFLAGHGLKYDLYPKKIKNEYWIAVRFPSTGKSALFADIASTGTKALQLFFFWSIVSFDKVSFLFIDEFDAFFHFQSASSIVRQLNKSSFQVVLTSHNTYLMQNEFTRPDCCFLMSESGIKNLPACTDREIRQAHNLEKMYINGVFV